MEKKQRKYKIKGHETFGIREGWLSKGMAEVEKDPRVFSKMYGADALGVGANMAKAVRYWLKASGITSEKAGVGAELTPFGRLVYDHDPYLEDEMTLWCIHMNLAQNKELATSWYLFFSKYRIEEFRLEDAEIFLEDALVQYTKKEDLSRRSIKDDCHVLLQMYSREKAGNIDPEDKKICPLSRLGLIRKSGNVYKRMQPDMGHFPKEALLYLMQSVFAGHHAVNMEELYKGCGGAIGILGLSMSAFQECLEGLAKEMQIEINRTAGLDMIYKKEQETKEQVLEHYYS